MVVGEEDKPPAPRPSEDPKCKEVLVISNRSTSEQESRLVIFEMVRDVEGQLAELRDIQLPSVNEKSHAETPLLDAFVDGFRMGNERAWTRARSNLRFFYSRFIYNLSKTYT